MEFLGKQWDIKIWNNQKLGARCAVDTETTFVPFTETPDLITIQVCDGSSVFYVPLELSQAFFEVNNHATFLFHNAAFDIDVLCKFWGNRAAFHDLIERDRIFDTSLMYRLLHLATVGYVPHGKQWSLAYLSERFLGIELSKDDDIRNNFEQFKGVPIEEIPTDFLEYGAKDAIATWHCFNAMLPHIARTGSRTHLSHTIQLAGSLALNRIYKRGIGFDLICARKVYDSYKTRMGILQDRLATYGWVRGQKGCNERFEWLVNEFYKLPLPKTETGATSSTAQDLQPYRNISFIDDYISFQETEKKLSFIKDIVETHCDDIL